MPAARIVSTAPIVFAFGHFAAETTQNVSYLLIRNMMADQAIQFATT